jgi:hypothetical protein
MEGRPQRVRYHLRRTALSRQKVTPTKIKLHR